MHGKLYRASTSTSTLLAMKKFPAERGCLLTKGPMDSAKMIRYKEGTIGIAAIDCTLAFVHNCEGTSFENQWFVAMEDGFQHARVEQPCNGSRLLTA